MFENPYTQGQNHCTCVVYHVGEIINTSENTKVKARGYVFQRSEEMVGERSGI